MAKSTMEEMPFNRFNKWRNIALLAVSVLLAKTLWFSASAVIPQLTSAWNLNGSQQSWMTMAVQIGFVAGCLISALLNIADRISSRHVLVFSALLGAVCNGAIPLLTPGLNATLLLRFLTGLAIAGVYPPGMKLIATWCREDRGLGIGILIGALTLGAALPHLINALPLFGQGGMPPWRTVMTATSILAIAAALIAAFFVKAGPFFLEQAPFNWRFAGQGLLYQPVRLANLGYLGHMWELYAMWTWCPIFIMASYRNAGLSLETARLTGFGVIAFGALGCIAAGILADRLGRTRITIWSLILSGLCCLLVGFFFHRPMLVTLICFVWGFAVVADSAQFSAAITELTNPLYIGTILTVQTSLGFLLTLVTIRVIPLLEAFLGWQWVFTLLALGPVAGIVSMSRLRRLPEAANMASGNR
jgi:MFS family permease